MPRSRQVIHLRDGNTFEYAAKCVRRQLEPNLAYLNSLISNVKLLDLDKLHEKVRAGEQRRTCEPSLPYKL